MSFLKLLRTELSAAARQHLCGYGAKKRNIIPKRESVPHAAVYRIKFINEDTDTKWNSQFPLYVSIFFVLFFQKFYM